MTKQQFIEFIEHYQNFDSAIRRLEDALSGEGALGKVYLFETDWYTTVENMFTTFLDIHFDGEDQDLIYDYLFEDSPLIIYEKDNEIELSTLGDLYDYLAEKRNNAGFEII